MKLTQKIKEKLSKANSKEEALEILKKSNQLSDDDLAKVAGGDDFLDELDEVLESFRKFYDDNKGN